jgi:hypothetical protein
LNRRFIIDAHAHTGYPKVIFSPEAGAIEMLNRMNVLGIESAINLCSHRVFTQPLLPELDTAREEYLSSGGRIFYCGFFNPHRAEEDLAALHTAAQWPGFAGIKIHPSINMVHADDPRYEAVWKFASDNDLPIVAHTWSVSPYNPAQVFSTPDKFEIWVKRYRQTKFVIGHSGGRGAGRVDAVRMCNVYENVYMDCAGDIFCANYFESSVLDVPENKVLFGSDFPWIDHRAHLMRVFVSSIGENRKLKILRENAIEVYALDRVGIS